MDTGAPANAPIACTLDARKQAERRQQARRALAAFMDRYDRQSGRLTMHFRSPADCRSRVEVFIELERACCPFLSFLLETDGEHLVLKISGPANAETVLDQFEAGVRALQAPGDG